MKMFQSVGRGGIWYHEGEGSVAMLMAWTIRVVLRSDRIYLQERLPGMDIINYEPFKNWCWI